MSKIFYQITNHEKCTFVAKSVKKHTSNTFPKKLVLISKNKIKGKSRCSICLTERSFIDETESDLENALEIYLQFFTDWYYKHEDLLLEV